MAFGTRSLPTDHQAPLFEPVDEGQLQFRALQVGPVRYVDAPTAAVSVARLRPRESDAIALFSQLLQRRAATVAELKRAVDDAPPRGKRRLIAAFAAVAGGTRSGGEVDFLQIVDQSELLCKPLLNPLLRLPSGALVSPDALFVEAGLVHETNGRSTHEREDLFASMQSRHDAMTAAGLTVLHNTPRRLAREPLAVLAEVEACFGRLRGAGLPPGVKLLRSSAD